MENLVRRGIILSRVPESFTDVTFELRHRDEGNLGVNLGIW